jgi:methyl-accepting chemotaxis protein
MGFAVVADEVRALAQRCAAAARETTAKIEDSLARSERGVHLEKQVAQSLATMVDKARQVDSLVAQISAACQEQDQGISRLNSAVGQMDRVVQSNAASAEESASAAEDLRSQAHGLQQTIVELTNLVGSLKGKQDAPDRRLTPGPATEMPLSPPEPAAFETESPSHPAPRFYTDRSACSRSASRSAVSSIPTE